LSKINLKKREIGGIQMTDSVSLLEQYQIRTKCFKKSEYAWQETTGRKSQITPKHKLPPSALEKGVISKKTKGRERLFSGLFGWTSRLGMLFVTNAVRARTGAITANAYNRKSQQHKNDHQFFH
jgi:hypothetical protein